MRQIIPVLLTLILGLALLLVVAEMPTFGDPDNPAHNIVSERYLSQGVGETGAQNIVTAIITDYRAYDTLGEVTVLFAAIAAVLTVLNRLRLGVICPEDRERGIEDEDAGDPDSKDSC